MGSNFLPFDLHLYNFPVGEFEGGSEPKFKSLNVDIVRGVAARTGVGR